MDNKEKLEEAKGAVEEAAAELDLDQLDDVSGGSIKNVKKKQTTDITQSIADRI